MMATDEKVRLAAESKIGVAALELRRNKDTVDTLLRYISSSIDLLYLALAKRLITEREADMLRGRIAELKKLETAVQNDDGESHE